MIREYAKDINVIDYEVFPELQEFGEKVITKIPELHFINEYEIKIGYLIGRVVLFYYVRILLFRHFF
ncbi:MAG: hypothetical protein H6Q69_1767 [Firmicutes bacterium]|nr:hypothetical protein [Bacillota bacterium]